MKAVWTTLGPWDAPAAPATALLFAPGRELASLLPFALLLLPCPCSISGLFPCPAPGGPMFGGAGDVMIESSCTDFGEVLLLPIFCGKIAMDLGLGEGSTGEPKGFLRAGWNRVLMMLLYAMAFSELGVGV